MASDDGDSGVRGGGLSNASEEACGTDDVEGGDTKEARGIEDTGLFEGGGDDGDGGVDGVGDDEDACGRGNAGNGGRQVTNDRGVGLRDGSE